LLGESQKLTKAHKRDVRWHATFPTGFPAPRARSRGRRRLEKRTGDRPLLQGLGRQYQRANRLGDIRRHCSLAGFLVSWFCWLVLLALVIDTLRVNYLTGIDINESYEQPAHFSYTVKKETLFIMTNTRLLSMYKMN